LRVSSVKKIAIFSARNSNSESLDEGIKTAAAPAFIAESIYEHPSTLKPSIAANKLPFETFLESYSIPQISKALYFSGIYKNTDSL
jgi:hypothetical protein